MKMNNAPCWKGLVCLAWWARCSVFDWAAAAEFLFLPNELWMPDAAGQRDIKFAKWLIWWIIKEAAGLCWKAGGRCFPVVPHIVGWNSEKLSHHSWVAKTIPEKQRITLCYSQGNSSPLPSETLRKSALMVDKMLLLELLDLHQAVLWLESIQKTECGNPSILRMCSSDELLSFKSLI